MKTRITELFGIEYPIIQGGMAWVADYHLAAAVSNAGGLGLIGAASAPGDVVRTQIREAKKLTDKPFGVNIMLLSPYAEEVAHIVVEEGVKVVTTGAGNPGKYMEMWKAAGIKVVPVVASVALAKMMEKAGADLLKSAFRRHTEFPPSAAKCRQRRIRCATGAKRPIRDDGRRNVFPKPAGCRSLCRFSGAADC